MKFRTAVLAGIRDVHRAQRILFDDHIRLDRVAGPGDLPHVPLAWRRTFTGWELHGTVLPDMPELPHDHRPRRGHPC